MDTFGDWPECIITWPWKVSSYVVTHLQGILDTSKYLGTSLWHKKMAREEAGWCTAPSSSKQWPLVTDYTRPSFASRPLWTPFKLLSVIYSSHAKQILTSNWCQSFDTLSFVCSQPVTPLLTACYQKYALNAGLKSSQASSKNYEQVPPWLKTEPDKGF